MASEALNPYYGVDYSWLCNSNKGKCLSIAFNTLAFLVAETIAVTEAIAYHPNRVPFILACIASGAILIIYGIILSVQIRQKPAYAQIDP